MAIRDEIKWFKDQFAAEINAALAGTPLSVDLVCAIAQQESGEQWNLLRKHLPVQEVLRLCVGDTIDAPGRTAFPRTKDALTAAPRGDEMFDLAHQLLREMADATDSEIYQHQAAKPDKFVHGYGIFQYDLQFFRRDPDFFLDQSWASFDAALGKALVELKAAVAQLGYAGKASLTDEESAFVAIVYNTGIGNFRQSRGLKQGYFDGKMYYGEYIDLYQQIAHQVATPAAPAPAAAGAHAMAAAHPSPAGARSSGEIDEDPAAPAHDSEISETAGLEAARLIANLGIPAMAEALPVPVGATVAAAAGAGLGSGLGAIDIDRAKAFLAACMNSHPRVTYGLGKKVPFLNAVPGRDFTKVDCSGFVRQAIRLSTTPTAAFPDGSVVQHDWVRAHRFPQKQVADGGATDGAVRIAFLRPQDSGENIGHVVLIHNGMTLESHGRVGPDSRPWTGTGWQAKAFVYLLDDGLKPAVAAGGFQPFAAAAGAFAAAAPAGQFTVRHGHRYRATVNLSFFEQLATNAMISDQLVSFGFTNVTVTGSGATREAHATWNGPDTTGPIDPHLSNVAEEAAVPAGFVPAEVAAPAVVSNIANGRGRLFTTDSLPTHHDDLLIVRMKPESLAVGPTVAMAAPAPTTDGMRALAYLDRAGLVKQIVPLRRQDEPVAMPRLAATAAVAYVAEDAPHDDASAGVSFIELSHGCDLQELHRALAADPNVESVSQVAARYLAARPAARRAAAPGGATIEAVPPDSGVLWNLQKIRWPEAHTLADAGDVHVAVLDTGVDDQHPDLQIDSYHWRQPDLLSPVSNKDIVGHGTHVSGTIAALNKPGLSVKGICQCRLSVWKIFNDKTTAGPGSYYYQVDPILYHRALQACLDEGVDVINLSIGGPAQDDNEEDLFARLIDAGVTVVAAMGNDRKSNSPPSYPAVIPGVIAVGATGLDDRVTLFSNSGNHIAISAPGKAIWSTLPHYNGQTGFAVAIGPDGQPHEGKPIRREINFDAWDGTSMATPHVAGAAALLIAKNRLDGRRLTPAEVSEALKASAEKVPGMNGNSFSTDYGFGRLNLLTLLQ